jgi:NADP-dependent 3-hydroxy acid dehydrogenase YdfG
MRTRTPREVRGMVVAVTGAGHGIGREIAQVLSRAGARLALGDLDGDAVAAVAGQLGEGAIGIRLDVTDTASFTAFLDRAEAELGPLDVLVNNAGVMWVGPYDAETDEIAARQVGVNLLGVIRGARLAGPRMAARGHGQIVTLASAASRLACAGEATYAATKHAVLGYFSAVRTELRGSGVDVSLIMPGVVDTELAAGTATGPVRLLQPREIADAVLAAIRRPRFETIVPARIALLNRILAVLPQPGRDLVGRFTLPNQVAAIRHHDRRQEYEGTYFPGRPS